MRNTNLNMLELRILPKPTLKASNQNLLQSSFYVDFMLEDIAKKSNTQQPPLFNIA